jgi:prepilin-type N-terminal cleavage/methylation domain-containing protein
MRGRSGFTLIEMVISITLFGFVIVSLMQGLTTSILGSHRARMGNAAMDVARSQMEYIHQQDYIVYDRYGDPIYWNQSEEDWRYTDPYQPVMDLPDGFCSADCPDKPADRKCCIDINVSLVPAPNTTYPIAGWGQPVLNRSAMQQVNVTVVYSNGDRRIKMTGYKAPRLATVVRPVGRYPVSKEINEIPGMWGISDGGAQGDPYDEVDCCGYEGCHPENMCSGWGGYGSPDGGEGYYYIFRTGTSGPICCSWIYRDHPDSCFEHIASVGGKNYAYVYLYSGIPEAFGDEGQGQGLVEVLGSENYPMSICNNDPGCEYIGPDPPVGTRESSDGTRYLATIGTSGDKWEPGIYTVFFHNWGYYDIGIDTTSSSIAYYW